MPVEFLAGILRGLNLQSRQGIHRWASPALAFSFLDGATRANHAAREARYERERLERELRQAECASCPRCLEYASSPDPAVRQFAPPHFGHCAHGPHCTADSCF
jgi:hypothetical protein